MDDDLPADERIDSLELLDRLDLSDRRFNEKLSGVLAEPGTPESVRSAVLEFLLRRDHPGLARHAVAAIGPTDERAPLREQILDWLARHRSPEVLAEVVKMWASEGPDSDKEREFRDLVEQISGSPWRQALLDALDARGFAARGSALEVLRARVDEPTLRRLLLSMNPHSDAVAAMQLFIGRFDYLPEDRESLLTIVLHAVHRRELVDDAARLYRQWSRDHGYAFRPRDFHLLSRLAGDPLRSEITRTDLVLEVGQSVNRRRHVIHGDEPAQPGDQYADSFWVRLDDLGIADLWRLYLLNEMLSRTRVRMAMRRMARLDREDTGRAWGGLVVYRAGQAEAKLYPGGHAGQEWRYVPGDDLLADQRDSLCMFHAHFSRIENIRMARPRPEQLRQARRGRYDALLLTSIDEDHFSAHYYNAEGAVVSLGIFPYGQ